MLYCKRIALCAIPVCKPMMGLGQHCSVSAISLFDIEQLKPGGGIFCD